MVVAGCFSSVVEDETYESIPTAWSMSKTITRSSNLVVDFFRNTGHGPCRSALHNQEIMPTQMVVPRVKGSGG